MDILCVICKTNLESVIDSDDTYYHCESCDKKYHLDKFGKVIKWTSPCPRCKSKNKYTTWCGSDEWYECVSCNCCFYADGYKQQSNYELHKRILEIEKKMNEIYYAPGMPGFLKAKANYLKDNSYVEQ